MQVKLIVANGSLVEDARAVNSHPTLNALVVETVNVENCLRCCTWMLSAMI